MENNNLQQAFTRAAQAMRSLRAADVQALPTFDCARILRALPDDHNLKGLRKRLANRLRTQLTMAWIQDGDMHQVFAALSALWSYKSTDLSGKQLGAAVQRLIASEAAVGGPYYSNHNLDIVANAQIAIFMRQVARPLPRLNEFLTESVIKRRLHMQPDLLYVLHQACPMPQLTRSVARQWHQKDWQTPEHLAKALIILSSNLPKHEYRQALLAICDMQQPNGFWKGSIESQVAKPDIGALVATSLVLNILDQYLHAQMQSSGLPRRHLAIVRAAKQMFNTYSEPLRSSALATLKDMCDADKGFEITLLPHFFAEALQTPTSLAPRQSTVLGLASLYVWMAYTIYDDFLDAEGDPAKLPVANIAMRASLQCYRDALHKTDFQQCVDKTFQEMDEANAWEVANCRFTIDAGHVTITDLPKYGNCSQLAARSFAHALAPIAVAMQLLPSSSKASIHSIESAFRHYLIARQLNDDIHDWRKDMQVGQVNYVVAAILRDMRVRPGTYRLAVLTPAMQTRFRRTTMPKICRRIQWHINRARKEFASSHLLQTPNAMYALLNNLEQSVHYSLDKHSKAQALYTSTRELGWQ